MMLRLLILDKVIHQKLMVNIKMIMDVLILIHHFNVPSKKEVQHRAWKMEFRTRKLITGVLVSTFMKYFSENYL